MRMAQLVILVPCFNAEPTITVQVNKLRQIVAQQIEGRQIKPDSRIILIDNGSEDQTWPLVQRLAAQTSTVTGLKLSRHFGRQGAILAGLMAAGSDPDVAIIFDQPVLTDTQIIPDLLASYRQGHRLIWGIPNDQFVSRSRHHKRPLVTWQLLSRQTIRTVLQFSEVTWSLQDIIVQMGSQPVQLYYDRSPEDQATIPIPKGPSLTTLWLHHFFQSVTVLFVLGGIIFMLSGGICLIEIMRWWLGRPTTGSGVWGAVLSGLFGLQLIGLGIIGTYLKQVLSEVRHRPHYVIDQRT